VPKTFAPKLKNVANDSMPSYDDIIEEEVEDDEDDELQQKKDPNYCPYPKRTSKRKSIKPDFFHYW
jgi:hypothetical protein